MKTFVTIMKWTVNADLIKMTGQIPYNMYKNYGYDSYLVTYKNECIDDLDKDAKTFNLPVEKYTYHENLVKGLKLSFIEREGTFLKLDIGILKYLFKNSKKIDVLNLYHYSLQTMIYTLIYKMLNKKGIVYVTLDNDLGSLDFYPGSLLLPHKSRLRNLIAYKIIEPIFLKKVNLLSNETKKGVYKLQKLYKNFKDKFFYLPYGIDERFILEKGIKPKSFKDKENIILTVARIGNPQKNNEMLLNAIENINLKDWRVILAGKIDDNFKSFIDDFFKKNPLLKEKVVFTGHISDRSILYDLYNRAKIFCLTSNFESFGIVMVEAGYFGDYIITTDVVSAWDITDNGKCGKIIPRGDIESLKTTLNNLIENQSIIEENVDKICNHIRKNFLWNNIISALQLNIERILKERK